MISVNSAIQPNNTKAGILPPKDWKPDPFAGLGPELSPQEKLQKRWQDLRKPMYMYQEQSVTTNNVPGIEDGTVRTIAVSTPEGTQIISNKSEMQPEKKTFAQKIKGFFNRLLGRKSADELIASIPEKTENIKEKKQVINTIKKIQKSEASDDVKKYWAVTSEILNDEIQFINLGNHIEQKELQRKQIAQNI